MAAELHEDGNAPIFVIEILFYIIEKETVYKLFELSNI